MKNNGFHRSCNRTSRRFFEDFDLLPREAKELIWYGNLAPNFEDLRAAWQLSSENFNLSDLLRLHSFEEERKAEEKKQYEFQQEQKRQEMLAAKKDRYDRKHKLGKYSKTVQVYQRVLVSNKRQRSNDRLVRLVSDEQALRLLTQRKENRDVVAAGPVWVNRFVGHVAKEQAPEPEVNYAQFEPQQHICKAFHNS